MFFAKPRKRTFTSPNWRLMTRNAYSTFGALIAFAVAATPFAILGIGSAFWSVFAGIGAALIAEREALLVHWQTARKKAQAPMAEQA